MRALFAVVIAAGALAGSTAALAGPDLGGVYKHRFSNALVSGEAFTSEDVLEIVPIAPGRAYLRAELQFFNGHVCSFAGVAREQGGGLVYRAPKGSNNGDGCVLALRPRGGRLVFSDKGGQCRAMTCGARGGYSGAAFPLNARRPIRYMPLLRRSEEYRAALNEAGLPAPTPR